MITKFRFWYEREDFYPDENFMSDVWQIEYVTDSIIYLNDSFTFNPYTNVARSSYAKAKIYLMQSSGIKDVNDKEIFEGDYLSIVVFESQKEYRGEVIFYKGSFCIVIKDYQNPYEIPLRGVENINYLLNVLGNVYENPELIDKNS